MAYIGNQAQSSFTSFDKQTLTGDGTTGPYTLSHAVSNEQEIEVFVNNVRQEPSVAYTASGDQLTMTGNVASTDDFYVVFQGKALQTVVPPAGSVTDSMIVGMASSKLTGALPAIDGSSLTGVAKSNPNLIVNGAMTVNQRGDVTGSTGYGGPDRFYFARAGAVVVDRSQSTDVPSGQGFAYSYKIDVTTADNSLTGSDYALFTTRLEGQNLQHLKKGTSSAESVTLSFWIKSSTTGTYVIELYDTDNTRQVSQSYTVDTADTWEKKELTFAGDTSGVLDNDNGASLSVTWWLAASSTFSGGTLNTSWASATNANRAVGQVNAIDDAANNIFITGIQLEVGETATPFEHEDYGTTLRKCQRYFAFLPFMALSGFGSTAVQGLGSYTVDMRATPTFGSEGVLNITNAYSADYVQSSTGVSNIASTNTVCMLNLANFSGVGNGSTYYYPRNSTNTNRITLDAEL